MSLENLSVSARFGLFAAGFACAVVSWKYIETPFRKHSQWKSRRRVFQISGASLGLIVVSGIICVYCDGFPNRVSATTLAAVEAELDLGHRYEHDEDDIRAGNVARIGAAESGLSPVLLVWGDSHAMAALAAIDEVLKERELTGCAAVHSSTAPVVGWFGQHKWGLNERSIDFNNAVLAYIEAQDIPNVILHAAWDTFVRKPDIGGVSFEDALLRTVKQLRSLNVNVCLMLDVPKHPVHVPKALSRLGGDYMALNVAKPDTIDKFDGIQPSTIARIKELGAIVIDPKPLFLNLERNQYRVQVDGVVLYRDRTHLTASGAVKILKPLIESEVLPN